MKIHVVCTGSKGNCYILENNHGKKLILDFGGDLKKIKWGLGFSYENIEGVLLTHEHGDHSKNWKFWHKNFGFKMIMSAGTAKALKIIDYIHAESEEIINLSTFMVLPFAVKHDAAEPLGFVIRTDGQTILYATDTSRINHNFGEIDHFLIETNFSEELVLDKIERGEDTYVNERILKSHYSIEMAIEYMKQYKNIKNIIGVHISDRNGDSRMFQRMLEDNFPYASCIIADNGMNIELNPF